jgi:hypothetical protein
MLRALLTQNKLPNKNKNSSAQPLNQQLFNELEKEHAEEIEKENLLDAWLMRSRDIGS